MACRACCCTTLASREVKRDGLYVQTCSSRCIASCELRLGNSNQIRVEIRQLGTFLCVLRV